MSMYRKNLPQLNGIWCITDGGMETDLVFNHNIDLPEFASYDLLRIRTGEDWLERIKGLRGNASCLSHAELDESTSLDDGDPEAFGRQPSTLLDA